MSSANSNDLSSISGKNSSQSDRPPIFLTSNDDQGAELATSLNLEINDIQCAPTDAWYLSCKRGELAICHSTEPPLVIPERSIRGKIDDARYTSLAKACAANHGRTILDAFGGWGIDGMALSALGCEVTILEVNPLICTMARHLAQELGSNAKVVCAGAEQYLHSSTEIFDVIYFDPMFPIHPKKAKPMRRMQVLEVLAWKDTDLDRVFELAKHRSRDRIVVKRRRTALPQQRSIDWSVLGKTVCFDVYRVS